MKYLVMQVTTNFAIASRYNAQLELFHCLDNVSIEVQRNLHYPAIWPIMSHEQIVTLNYSYKANYCQ